MAYFSRQHGWAITRMNRSNFWQLQQLCIKLVFIGDAE